MRKLYWRGPAPGAPGPRVSRRMRIAHFVHRYPPALGGAEAYFARLSREIAAAGHEVTVFTTNALDLEALWSCRGRTVPEGRTVEEGVEVHRYSLIRWPLQALRPQGAVAAALAPAPGLDADVQSAVGAHVARR